MKKLDKLDYFSIFILLQPLLDLITSISTHFHVGNVTLGIVVRSVFILVMLIYLFFFNSSKYKSVSIKYIWLLMLFVVGFFVTKLELVTNFSFFIKEVVYLVKYLYFPVLFITLFNLYDQYKLDRKRFADFFIVNLFVYALLLIIPFFTGTSFDTYVTEGNKGVIGVFYSANEVSALLCMLFPTLFLYVNKKIDYRISFMTFTTLFAVMLIGTKVTFFGTLLFLILVFVYYIVNYQKYKKANFMYVGILILIMVIMTTNLPVVNNLKNSMGEYNENVETSPIICDDCDDYEDNDSSFISRILSSRDKRVMKLYNIYSKRPMEEKLFGIGFSDREVINTKRIERNVEMDFFEVFLRYGIIGFIMYISAFVLIIVSMFKYVIKKKFKLKFEQFVYLYVIIIGFGVAFVAGHVFGSPPVSIYLAFILVFSKDVFNDFAFKPVNKKKVTFLCLHLGVGGIERAVVNTANALVEEKDVTIISFYKLDDKNYYDIDNRIKIKYLYIGGPNREEFKNALKSKNIFHIIKEGFTSLIILMKKRRYIIRSIKDIKEGIVVSTRVEFSVLLSTYGRDSVVKIACEHNYHNNDKKYLNKMKYGYGNIDYIVALTNRLRDDYEALFIENNKIKAVTIGNMLSDVSRKVSNLKNKTIVTVSRLHPDKRVDELVDIFAKTKNKEWKFKIIGDGQDFDKIKKKIKKLGLEKNIKLMGNIPNNEVIKELTDSSIFVMASISEGFAIVVVEALSVGLPALCYEIENGIVDIIENGKEGFLIKDRNEKEFVKFLSNLMDDEHLRKSLSKNALIKQKEFSKENIAKEWFNLIDNSSL